MEVHQIRYFLSVIANRHFGRAANECNVTQPALTRAIQKLEDELGGTLLVRKPNQIELTALGRKVFPHLKQAYAETTQAKVEARAFGERRRSKLRVGVMCTIGPWMLAELFARLAREVPNLDIAITEASGQDLIEALASDDVDIAIIALPDYPENVVVHPMFKETYVVAFPRGHRFEAMTEVALTEMANEDYLERLNCEFEEFYERRFGEWEINLRVRCASENENWIQAMVQAGMGCALFPANFPQLPGLMTRPLGEPKIEREISAVFSRSATLAGPAKAFADLVSRLNSNALSAGSNA